MHLTSITGVLCLFSLAVIYRLARRLSRHPLPPGPPGLPFIGNALQIPADQRWLIFSEWAKKYGHIMHLSVLGSPLIVLSSPDAIFDLLEKRSALYSDRPRMQMAESIGYDRYVSIERYGNRHREGRKIILNSLSARKIPVLQQLLEQKVTLLLARLLRSPASFCWHVRWYVASTVLQITHGHHVEDFDDPVVRIVESVLEEFSLSVTPGAYLVDSLPFLRYLPEWVPGTGFKAVAKARRDHLDTMRAATYERVKTELAHGTALPSLTAELLESSSSSPTAEEEDLYESTTVAFYAGGADTTVSAIESFFLIMILYPDVQRKAQAELDSVLEPGCLPKFSDRSKLSYIDALIKEIHRWNPVVPTAVPHRLIQDDVYDGYHIPAGSVMIPNSWAVMHDPSLYPDPFNVVPERYLKEDGKLNPDPRLFSFGYGRRICPGQALAEETLFIVVAMVLATLNIDKAVDSDGLPIEPDVNYTGSTITHAAPFECRISPRSAETEQLVMMSSGGDKI